MFALRLYKPTDSYGKDLHQCSRPQTVSQRANHVSASIINHRITLCRWCWLTGGQVTLEYAIVCRLRYQSQLRMHKYCMRPPLIRLSDDEGGIGDGAGKLSTWSTKARTENMSDWKLCKEFPLWVFGISVRGANLDLVNHVVILTHLSGLHCCCVVLSIVAYFTPFLWLSLWKGWSTGLNAFGGLG